jgi:nitroreductase
VITKEQWVEFVASRRSTRDFTNQPVADSVIDELITDALTAPSWSNTRPFLVAVATGEKRDRISAEFLKRSDCSSLGSDSRPATA